MIGILYAIYGIASSLIVKTKEDYDTYKCKEYSVNHNLDIYYDSIKKCNRYTLTDEPCDYRYGDGRTTMTRLINTKTGKVIKTYPTPRSNTKLTKEEFNEKMQELDRSMEKLREAQRRREMEKNKNE